MHEHAYTDIYIYTCSYTYVQCIYMCIHVMHTHMYTYLYKGRWDILRNHVLCMKCRFQKACTHMRNGFFKKSHRFFREQALDMSDIDKAEIR